MRAHTEWVILVVLASEGGVVPGVEEEQWEGERGKGGKGESEGR
jgi:hypothetical protein